MFEILSHEWVSNHQKNCYGVLQPEQQISIMYIFFKNDKAGEEMFKNLVVNYLKTRLKVTRDKTEKEEEK